MVVPKPPRLHLSSANIDRTGVYLLDALDSIYLYVGSAAPQDFIQEVLDAPNFTSIPDGMVSKNNHSDKMQIKFLIKMNYKKFLESKETFLCLSFIISFVCGYSTDHL